jgi:hypothetical protein
MNNSKKLYLNTEVDFPGKSRVLYSHYTVTVGSAPASLIAVMLNTFFHGRVLQMNNCYEWMDCYDGPNDEEYWENNSDTFEYFNLCCYADVIDDKVVIHSHIIDEDKFTPLTSVQLSYNDTVEIRFSSKGCICVVDFGDSGQMAHYLEFFHQEGVNES